MGGAEPVNIYAAHHSVTESQTQVVMIHFPNETLIC